MVLLYNTALHSLLAKCVQVIFAYLLLFTKKKKPKKTLL